MISLHYYLDCRAVEAGKVAPLKLTICKRGKVAQLRTGISLLPTEWDARAQQVIVSPRRKVLNAELARLRTNIEDHLRPMIYEGRLADKNANQIRDIVSSFLDGDGYAITFKEIYDEFLATKGEHTQSVYRTSWSQARAADQHIDTRSISDCSPQWVLRLDKALVESGRAYNTRSIIIHSLAAAWHYAIRKRIAHDDIFDVLHYSPQAGRKRDLTAEQMKAFLRYAPTKKPQSFAKDAFLLSFYLRAINISDLLALREEDMFNGRIYYKRNKTRKDYSVKVEPEAMEIINRRRARGVLFYTDDATAPNNINRNLRIIAKEIKLPEITTYWARHTWASLAFSLEATMDLVSAGLGHSLGGAKVTSTYVNIDEFKVDELNRKIIDLVTK